jgi:hypothetical protein
MLNNIVNNQEQYEQQNIVQACFQQHWYRLGVFLQCTEKAKHRNRSHFEFLTTFGTLESVNALPKVAGFLQVLRFPPTGKVDMVG